MPRVRRLLTIVLLAAAAGLLIAAGVIRVIENRLIYFPPRYPEGFIPQEAYGVQVEDVWLHTADGVKINAFFHSNPDSKQVLLWFHGNAENIGYGLSQMRELATLGTNILAVDYRGYGKSEGAPYEAGVYKDADAAYDYLVKQRQFRPQDILVYGHSLGGAVAVNLASRRPCGGLIVQSLVHECARHGAPHACHSPHRLCGEVAVRFRRADSRRARSHPHRARDAGRCGAVRDGAAALCRGTRAQAVLPHPGRGSQRHAGSGRRGVFGVPERVRGIDYAQAGKL